MDLGFVVLEPADRWREFFYADRWYNVFEIRDGDGRLKGWYCNITRPARIGPDEFAAEDLALDLWVTPDGASELLDEEDFAELELEPEERRKAREALLDLRHRVETGQSPFGGERQVGDR